VSQTLVGIAQGRHTVDVKRDWDLVFSVENEHTVTLQKKTPSGQALPGMQFDFYFVAGRDEYLAWEKELPEKAEDYTDLPETPNSTVITGEDGCATLNLTENNLPDGVYLVAERDHPAIVGPADPFYVLYPASTKKMQALSTRSKSGWRTSFMIRKSKRTLSGWRMICPVSMLMGKNTAGSSACPFPGILKTVNPL